MAERQRLVQAAQLRHLERRSDAAKRLGGSPDPAAARAIEQAVLHHLGTEVTAPLHLHSPTCLLQVIAGSHRPISCHSREPVAFEVEGRSGRCITFSNAEMCK